MRPTDNGSAGTVKVSVKTSSPFRVGNQTQDYPLGWGTVRESPIGTFSSHYMMIINQLSNSIAFGVNP